jgi:CheY-like chemotaxis protein
MSFVPTVLVVDDNPADARLLGEAFHEARVPVNIESVHSGSDAVCRIQGWGKRFAGRRRPDLVLLDLQLPKISGKEVLAFIKGQPLHQSIPTLVFTAALRKRDQEDCEALGADACLRKPDGFIGYPSIVETILEHLAGRVDDGYIPAPREEGPR